jgi:putative transposase
MRIPRWRLGTGVFHVVNRATNGAWILADDADKEYLVCQFRRFGEGRAVQIYHWAVMSTHFHLAVEALEVSELSYVVGQACRRFTLKWHRRHGGSGRLWQERFKSIPVQKAGYLERLGCYIERNPARAGVAAAERPWEYPWTSAGAYCSGAADPLVDVATHPYWPLMGANDASRQSTYRGRLTGVPAITDVELFGVDARLAVGDEQFVANVRRHPGGRCHARSRGRPRRA